MAPIRSKVTAQGQISVPAAIRRRLGIGPGSVLEWDDAGEDVVVRRAATFTSEDIYRVLFPDGPPPPRPLGELKEGIKHYMRKRHARR